MSAQELVDSHCHLNFDSFADDRAEVLGRAAAASVRRMIVPAIDLASCEAVLAFAEQYKGIYAAVGTHPNSVFKLGHVQLDQLRAYARCRKTVAIGEIGLDYYWDKQPRPLQRRAFATQLELAAELGLPVIIHNREASDDVLEILEDWVGTLPDSLRERPGVLHSFSGGPNHAERALSIGFSLGFTGPITFKKSDELRVIASRTPLNRILVETDAPFLTPHPYRGKRNEPSYLRFVNDKLAESHGISPAEMARQTTANAERLFALPPAARRQR